ncbi:MAG: C_GCAxxG_C_C family protein [Bacteroidales bacterium]|nr:C_GCAxxG_C_C family protein [Candidatus Physcocola equi]
MSPELENRIQQSVELFMQGYGCSQSVVAAFADLYGVDDQTAKRMAAGFGGGVGRMRMMCGAVSGLVMLAGLDCGQTEGSDKEGKAACYKVVQDLLATFKERNGSVICAELLGMNGCKVVTDTNIPDERNAEYYKKRPCAKKVESAARIFAEYLAQKQEL